ncbi:hypothetical protein B7453_22200 [Pseudomonas sp. IB20]|nr:hypothetical protein B7453_22200 [Pseudomonas sp. IB20]
MALSISLASTPLLAGIAVPMGYLVTPIDNLTFDVAYSYLKEEPIKVRQTQPARGLTYHAKYENSANGFGGSVTYRF